DEQFLFEGSGWGHGVGMSQYGARGLALEGKGAADIISYFYRGASVGTASLSHSLWVGLLQNRIEIRFEAREGSLQLGIRKLPEGQQPKPLVAEPGESWALRRLVNGNCRYFKDGQPQDVEAHCWASVSRPPDQPQAKLYLADTGRTYGRGTLRVRPIGEAFHVLLEIGLEKYLYGLGEMPSSWPAAALQAQAIAARSYAVRRALNLGAESGLSAVRRQECWCHLYATVKDQAYVGWEKEEGHWGAVWRNAIDATAGRVVTYGGQVISTFYFSSSGGATENNVDGFGGTTQLPYLTSVADPWSLDRGVNPNASWSGSIAAGQIATAVGLEALHSVRVISRNPSGSAKEVEFLGIKGKAPARVVKLGREVRSLLGLRSSYFRVYMPPFRDDDGSVHEAAIVAIWRHDITRGCDASNPQRYCPEELVTRGQMAAFLVRGLGLQAQGAPDAFSDDNGHLFEADINALAESGVTKGCYRGRFCPDEPVNRGEMAAFLLRALTRHSGSDHSGAAHLPTYRGAFSDVGADRWDRGFIEHLQDHGITFGYPDGTYRPEDLVTRAEMASFLARTFDLR
ncbi:MAG: SpoIID/LytB domain-containing protein, partial [Actinomycetota bacterium]|nr:SpoIID/LytB domain-containing protein [Actinomycetota bacterium]